MLAVCPSIPIQSVVDTFTAAPNDLVLDLETITQTLIEEPPDGDSRNLYFRQWPRRVTEFAVLVLLKRNPKLATPGAVWGLLSDPEMMATFAAIEAQEASGYLKSLAKNILAMAGKHEHWPQHLQAAQDALKIFRCRLPPVRYRHRHNGDPMPI